MQLLNAKTYIEKFLKIRTKDGEIEPLILNPPQQRLYDAISEQWRANKPVRIIILKARQMGFSTLTEAIVFYLTATARNVDSMIVAHTEEATANLFRMSKRYLDLLPDPLKPMQRASNAQELIFDRPAKSSSDVKGLGSRIRCATAGGKGVGRSYTLKAVHLSELAFWPGDKIETFSGLSQAVPDAPGTVIIIESTANGYDFYKKLWDAAVKSQREGTDGYTPVFFAWFEMPTYRRTPLPNFKRTSEEEKLAETFHLDDEQLAWRRWCIATNCGGDLNKFHQEYPATPDEAFISTGSCAFNQEVLVLRREQVRLTEWERGRFKIQKNEAEKIISFEWTPEPKGPIRILKHPEEDTPYVIGGDTAGTGSDAFVGQVLDNTTGEQVAVLHHRFGEREYAEQMYCLGKYYNEALIGIETNYSTYPELKIEELGYTNLFVRERIDTYTGKMAEAFGFATTTKTRPLIIDGLKDVVNGDINNITDYDTLGEMLTFVYDEHWKPQAEEGEHDDLVMALAIAHYIRPQQSFSKKHKAPNTTVRWTQDQWDDYNHANQSQREYLRKIWGNPER